MTIVLQHQFEGLTVDELGFSVVLRFNGKPQKLSIPFDTVTSFSDPSVNFGLQLKTFNFDGEDLNELAIDPVNNFDELSIADATEIEELEGEAISEHSVNSKPKTGEVITLDAFRKK